MSSPDSPSPPPPLPSLAPGDFATWRAPRRGTANPQDQTNPLWSWLIASRLSAFEANRLLEGPSSIDAGPMWCFQRFGQSSTRLDDGTEILIGGEHEDHYDADFWIYNDLTLLLPGQPPRILGYPVDAFPPTDFHSATQVGDRIIVIGNLGYPEDRRPGETQVLAVARHAWSVTPLTTSGTPPGWIHGHQAVLATDGASVRVQGGKVDRGHGFGLVENIDEWQLHLAEARWERLTCRQWERFTLVRSDGRRHHLWEIRQAAWAAQIPWPGREEQLRELAAALGGPPDLALLPHLYRPPLPHEALPESDDEFGVHRLRIEGLMVRLVEDTHTLQVTVEGRLPSDVSAALRRHLVDVFSRLERTGARIDEIGE